MKGRDPRPARRAIEDLLREKRPAEPGKARFPADREWARLREMGTRLWLDTGDMEGARGLWTEEMEGLTTNNTLLNAEVQKGIYDKEIPAVARALREAEPDVERMARIYNERRAYLVPELKRLGFGIPNEGEGAFYVFADVRPFRLSSSEFVSRLLHEAHVATTPGNDFGGAGDGFVRFSYANSLENIQGAVSRIEAFLTRL